MIRNATAKDSRQIVAIYNRYINESTATFEIEPITEEDMSARITEISSHHPFLVYEICGQVEGYCYAHPWKEREAYRHTLETTIYIAPEQRGKGIGRMLMRELIARCTGAGVKALIACITAENTPSVAMHRKIGFKKVSHFEKVGRKFDRWLDVVDYELLLD